VVGVNCFTGEHEIDVSINRVVEATYDPELMKTAEEPPEGKSCPVKTRTQWHGCCKFS